MKCAAGFTSSGRRAFWFAIISSSVVGTSSCTASTPMNRGDKVLLACSQSQWSDRGYMTLPSGVKNRSRSWDLLIMSTTKGSPANEDIIAR